MSTLIPKNFVLEKDELTYFCIISLTLVLFCTTNYFHYPYALMSILGCFMLYKDIRRGDAWRYKTFFLLYFSIWAPMVVATIFSPSMERSFDKTILYLHFFPSTYFLLKAGLKFNLRRMLAYVVLIFFVFLLFDSIVQYFLGWNLLGQPLVDGKITSIFYPKQRLGIILVLFFPIVVSLLLGLNSSKTKNILSFILCFSFILVVTMTLKRSAWLMMSYLFVVVTIFNFNSIRSMFLWKHFVTVIIFVVSTFFTIGSNTDLRNLLNKSAGVFSANEIELNDASNGRYDLWRTGFSIAKENPFFGVGPRVYRDVYREYASPDDFWINRYGHVQTHPHLFLIEILCETGLFGLLLFGFANIKLFRYYRRCPAPWLLSSIVAAFPLNLHLAFYGSYWASILWFFLGIGLGEVLSQNNNENKLVQCKTNVVN